MSQNIAEIADAFGVSQEEFKSNFQNFNNNSVVTLTIVNTGLRVVIDSPEYGKFVGIVSYHELGNTSANGNFHSSSAIKELGRFFYIDGFIKNGEVCIDVVRNDALVGKFVGGPVRVPDGLFVGPVVKIK